MNACKNSNGSGNSMENLLQIDIFENDQKYIDEIKSNIIEMHKERICCLEKEKDFYEKDDF